MAKIDMRDAFFERLTEVARKDERIVVLSADHGAFALEKFQEEMPDRYINMGIAEQNMVGVAAGLEAPVAIMISTNGKPTKNINSPTKTPATVTINCFIKGSRQRAC